MNDLARFVGILAGILFFILIALVVMRNILKSLGLSEGVIIMGLIVLVTVGLILSINILGRKKK